MSENRTPWLLVVLLLTVIVQATVTYVNMDESTVTAQIHENRQRSNSVHSNARSVQQSVATTSDKLKQTTRTVERSSSDANTYSEISASVDLLSLHVNNRSLAWILEQISKQTGVTVLLKESGIDRQVSIDINEGPLEAGLRTLLKNEDIMLLYGPQDQINSRLKAVLIFHSGSGNRIVFADFSEGVGGSDPQLNSADSSLRAEAVRQSVDRLGIDSKEIIMMSLNDEDSHVREQALTAAINKGFDLPSDKLIYLAAHDPSPMVRLHAVEALANNLQGDNRLERLAAMENVLQSETEAYVRESAERWIEELNSSNTPSDEMPAPPGKAP